MTLPWRRVATRPPSSRAQNRVIALWLAGAVLAAGVLAWERWRELKAAEVTSRAMTALLAAHTTDAFRIADLGLEDLARTMESSALPPNDSRLQEKLAQRVASAPFMRAVYVIGPDGFITQDSDFPATPRISLADRPYFSQYLQSDAPVQSMSGPFQSRSGQGWFLTLTRQVKSADKLQGVAVVAFRLAYLGELHQRLRLPQETQIFLFRDDGVLLAQHPAEQATVGASYATLPLFETYLPIGEAGVFRTAGPPFNYSRMVSYERVSRQPLVVGLVQHVDTALAGWWGAVAVVSVGMLLVLAAMLFGARQYDRGVIERAQARDRLRRGEKMEAVGQLTSGLAHDFGNLLNIVHINLELISRIDGADPKLGLALGRARHAVDNGKQLVQQLLSFSRKQELSVESTDLNKVVVALEPLLQQAAGNNQVLTALSPEPMMCELDRRQLEVALINLVVNARDALERPGEIILRTRRSQRPGSPDAAADCEIDWICLSVEDDGRGMPADVQARALDPFFTTKGDNGTGLGLAQVQMLLLQLGGDVSIASRVGEGTSIKLWIPAQVNGGLRPANTA